MKIKLLLFLVGAAQISFSQTIPTTEVQIKTALLACPDESKEKALVYGYSPKGEFVVIRQGTNEMVCLADDPNQPGLNVSCYHKSLDPFMARGRELKKKEKNFKRSLIFVNRKQKVENS